MQTLLDSYKNDPVKVDLFSPSQMKLVFKDFISLYLSKRCDKENHKFTDLKLFVGFISAIIGGGVMYCINFIGFNEHRGLLLIGVMIFMLLNTLIPIYENFFVGRVIFKGVVRNFMKYEVYAVDKEYDEFVKLKIVKNRVNVETKVFKLAQMFYDDGSFCAENVFRQLEEIFMLKKR